MKRSALCLFTAAAALLFAAAPFAARGSLGAKPAVFENFRLGTYVRLSLYGARNAEEKLKAADDIIVSLENLFSMNIPSSDIARLNAAGGGWVAVSQETTRLIALAVEMADFTGGAFNPALGGLSSLWKIGSPDARVPSGSEISEALKHTDYTKIELRSEKGAHFAKLPRGMALDLGAIAKGYVADRLKDFLSDAGARGAIIDLGGNLDFIGEPPRGGPWRAGLQRPESPRGEYFGTIESKGLSVVTSGPYERYFEKNGMRYHHILDPATGRPAQSGLSSVTVADSLSYRADALCTALFVMGRRRAPGFLKKHRDIIAVLVTEEGEVLVTPPARDIFRLTSDDMALAARGDGE